MSYNVIVLLLHSIGSYVSAIISYANFYKPIVYDIKSESNFVDCPPKPFPIDKD